MFRKVVIDPNDDYEFLKDVDKLSCFEFMDMFDIHIRPMVDIFAPMFPRLKNFMEADGDADYYFLRVRDYTWDCMKRLFHSGIEECFNTKIPSTDK